MGHNTAKRGSTYAAIMISVTIAMILAFALTALLATLVASEKMQWKSAEYAVSVIQVSIAFVSCYIACKARNKLVAGFSVAILLTILILIGLLIEDEGLVMQWRGVACVIMGTAGAMLVHLARTKTKCSPVKKVRSR